MMKDTQNNNVEELGDVMVAREADEDEWESDRFSEYFPVGTIYKKRENKPDYPSQIPFVWAPEGSKIWPLSEREVRYFLEIGYFKKVKQ